MPPKSTEAWFFLLLCMAGLSIALGQLLMWLVDKLHEWRNERAIRRILDGKDEPPSAI